MFDSDEFLRLLLPKKARRLVKYATVTEVREGRAVIQFAEDDRPSQKLYKAFKSYSPAQGDRIMLIDNIIIGGWGP